MTRCDYCNTFIFFGGFEEGHLRFCSAECYDHAFLFSVVDQVPVHVVKNHIAEVAKSPCPECGETGSPIDFHVSHWVWSALIMTSWNSKPLICCKDCGIKSRLFGTLFSFTLGWWGWWGIIMTPVQLMRNIWGIIQTISATEPSEQFETMAKLELAEQLLEEEQH